MLTLNLSLNNQRLYHGCQIEEVAGRKNLITPVAEAVNIIGKNAEELVSELKKESDEICLTGAMAIWAYLVVFHVVVHRFRRVWYDDDKGNKILIAAHG
ncbi:MAG: hypothetical protein KIS94_05035 [Chitinophagales bacterium]|nr:hypothetical protein [Chitinophagales bacterium]